MPGTLITSMLLIGFQAHFVIGAELSGLIGPPTQQATDKYPRGDIDTPAASSAAAAATAVTPTNATTGTAPEVDPKLIDLCIFTEEEVWRINDTFTSECGESCRCAFTSEPRHPLRDLKIIYTGNAHNHTSNTSYTEFRCNLAPMCSHLLPKIRDCPNRKILWPDQRPGECACPQVSCPYKQLLVPHTLGHLSISRVPNIKPVVTAAAAVASAPRGCEFEGRELEIGKIFYDNCRSLCRCLPNRKIQCEAPACPTNPPNDILCAEWTLEQDFKFNPSENKCCQSFICKTPAIEPPSTQVLEAATAPPTTATAASTTTSATTTASTSTTSTTPAAASTNQASPADAAGKQQPVKEFERVPEAVTRPANDNDSCEKVCVCKDAKMNNMHNHNGTIGADTVDDARRSGFGPEYEQNHMDDQGANISSLPWTDQVQSQVNGTLQRYAWHLMVALCIMTVSFTSVSFLYLKKSVRVIAPISKPQSAYDNPAFTKLIGYYANQPQLFVHDEREQNYNNNKLLEKEVN